MVEDTKRIIKKYILLIILLIGIPSLTFWALFFTANLHYLIYITNSMAGWLTILFLTWIEISKQIKNKVASIIIGMVSIYIGMFVIYYSFNWISQTTSNITLTTTHLAEAGFSFIFGVCVALSFRLMVYKDKEKNWKKKMNDLKYKIKDFFRIYGYYFAIIFIFLGIAFFILSEIARNEVDINIYAEMYSNLWLTTALGFITIGIAFISIKIAIDSDYKINNISNANFLRVLSRFEDRRLDLQFPTVRQEGRYPNIVIWKALVDINEMRELLEFCDIKKDYQRKMMNLQCQFLRVINHNYQSILMCEAVKHLLQISNTVLNLEYRFESLRTELFSHIRNLFDNYGEDINDNERSIAIQPLLVDYTTDIIVNEQYINYMIQLSNALNYERFLDIREQFKIWFEEEQLG